MSPHHPSHHPRRASLAALCGLLTLCAATTAVHAQEVWTSAAPAEALCRYAAPLPPQPPVATPPPNPPRVIASAPLLREGARAPAEVPPTPSVATWIEARTARLLSVYAVDLRGASVRIAPAAEAAPQRLTLYTDKVFSIFGRGPGLALEAEPRLTFELAPERLDELRAGIGSGQIALRLVFTLSALDDAERPLCVASGPGSQLRVQGRLVAAWLWRWRGASTPTIPEEDLLAEHHTPEAAALGAFGLGVRGVVGALPRVAVQQSPAPDSLVPDDAPSNLPPELARDLERLALPCFLAAIGHGGPQTAALTLEIWFEGESPRTTTISVDATGFPPLGACVTARAGHLRAAGWTGGRRVRFAVYFDRAP